MKDLHRVLRCRAQPRDLPLVKSLQSLILHITAEAQPIVLHQTFEPTDPGDIIAEAPVFAQDEEQLAAIDDPLARGLVVR